MSGNLPCHQQSLPYWQQTHTTMRKLQCRASAAICTCTGCHKYRPSNMTAFCLDHVWCSQVWVMCFVAVHWSGLALLSHFASFRVWNLHCSYIYVLAIAVSASMHRLPDIPRQQASQFGRAVCNSLLRTCPLDLLLHQTVPFGLTA